MIEKAFSTRVQLFAEIQSDRMEWRIPRSKVDFARFAQEGKLHMSNDIVEIVFRAVPKYYKVQHRSQPVVGWTFVPSSPLTGRVQKIVVGVIRPNVHESSRRFVPKDYAAVGKSCHAPSFPFSASYLPYLALSRISSVKFVDFATNVDVLL